jgi:hypothetical protein
VKSGLKTALGVARQTLEELGLFADAAQPERGMSLSPAIRHRTGQDEQASLERRRILHPVASCEAKPVQLDVESLVSEE